MAQGDFNDIKQRLLAKIPSAWFSKGTNLIRDAIIAGLATAWANYYALYSYIVLQARIRTATGGFLDLAVVDFFGNRFPRNAGESDDSYRVRALSTLLQENGTRWAIYNALYTLTGRAPLIIEPSRPADTGSYRSGGCGYGTGGAYGSLLMPYSALVVAYRLATAGAPNIAGYGVSTGAYRTPSRSAYIALPALQQAVSDASIFAAVDEAKLDGTQVWVQLRN